MSNSRVVPFFDYPRLFLDHQVEFIDVVKDVASRGAFIMQKDLREFELALASYTGAKHAIGVANATDGLELALMAIGIQPGDEVICCSHTMLATAAAIVTAGGKPVPVELGWDNLIDGDAVEAAITRHTVGIMPTQLNGRTCDMDRIMAIADKHGLFVVEDAAQALGSKFKGKAAGTFGKAAAISFYPAKVLGCFGDGGGVITSDGYMYDRVFQLHDHGRDIDGEVRCWGRNSRLDNLQAAILSYGLKSYDKVVDRRRAIARKYQELLGGIEELMLPPSPDANADHFDVYQNYELQAVRRDELRVFLRNNGIGTLIQWGGKAVHQFERLGFTCRLPKVERFFERCIMLPMNVFLSDDDVVYICDKVHKFYRG
ncbi:MAG: DegT/DnrJ/EryC1/StrS family aminotransferase [Magnetococcales bacterium]|nr:DegT/DnrJ/EryC1/StrS family aminotransferase [Magnetococcales bacterium]NGZ25594.1 DegT/DnrJ/EryC1/StrS family aminotransferase [Magnetococcales bacterium]